MAFVDSLVAYYKMEDATDSSGKGYNGGSGGTFLTNGKFGKALDANTSFQVDSNADLNFGTGAFSFSFWMACTSSSTPIMGKYDGSSGFFDLYCSSGKILFMTGGSGDGQHQSSTASVNSGALKHIVLVRETNGDKKIYINGSLDSTTSPSITTLNNTNAFQIGTSRSWGAIFSGNIDDLGIWKGYALTQEDVTSIYGAAGELSTLLVSAPSTISSINGETVTRGTPVSVTMTPAPIADLITDDSYFADSGNWKEVRLSYGPELGRGGLKTLRYTNDGSDVFDAKTLLLSSHARAGNWVLKAIVIVSFDEEKYIMPISLISSDNSFTAV